MKLQTLSREQRPALPCSRQHSPRYKGEARLQDSVFAGKACAVSEKSLFLAEAHLQSSRKLTVVQISRQLLWAAFVTSTTTVILKMTVIGVYVLGIPLFPESWCMLALVASSSSFYYQKASKIISLGKEPGHSGFPSRLYNETSEIKLFRSGTSRNDEGTG